MIRYSVSYYAKNEYTNHVQEAFLEFLVRPLQDTHQQLITENYNNSAHSSPFFSRNVFGYEKIQFRLSIPFNIFEFNYHCTIQKNTEGLIPIRNDLISLAEEQQILTSEAFQVNHYLFIQQTSLTQMALTSIPESMRFQKQMYLLDYVKNLNQNIHQYITYTANKTTVYTSAYQVWLKPQGVCQDYSHLMIGILRSQGIPARYVSGYLNQELNHIGASQMHAWVEVYLPTLGWVGLDPTNNLWVDHHYIKVADGQDYHDCSPLTGHITPTGINYTQHSVHVQQQ